ncbi:Dyp-type peroxidase [Catenulispora sp. EB89]|uniref:Dyp-type peroxidase n=1 Tax=Catenulispora sp. EB89 TaxID=3156257 RepID=UPI003511DA41
MTSTSGADEPDAPDVPGRSVKRRRFLGFAGLAAGGTVSAGVVAGRLAHSDPKRPPFTMLTHLTTPPTYLALTALDVPGGQDAAAALHRLVVAGRVPSRAEISIALGSTWFDKAGPAYTRPKGLTAMPSFTGDVLAADLTHGDLLVHVAADSADLARAEAARLVAAAGCTVRWRKQGLRPENHIQDGRALTRNLFGFTEGLANPPLSDHTTAAEAALVAAGGGEPDWAVGGSYLVVRIIRFAQEFWDVTSHAEQARVIGRRPDGQWLDGTAATGQPAFSADPGGATTPLDAHVRRANPRTPGMTPPRMVRRGYSYQDGHDAQGLAQNGLVFMALQADLQHGFAAVQQRLAGQALDRFAITMGGGYFFVPDLDRHDAPGNAGTNGSEAGA